ncbi:MAG: DUF7507 domain-containing protein, partial [Dermatophilaceae bacterium]
GKLETNPRRRRTVALRRVTAAVAALVVGVLGGLASPALGYQINATSTTGTTGANGSSVITFPGGATATVGVSGPTTVSTLNSTLASRGATPGMFTPSVSTSTPMPELTVSADGCAANGLCTNRGVVTVTFSRPVRDPVLHLAGLGDSVGTAPNNSVLHALGTITGSTPAGATFGAPSSGNVNLVRTGGNLTFDTTGAKPAPSCVTTGTAGQTSLAGCGSLPIVGTYTSITIRMDVSMSANGTGTAGTAASGDRFVLGVSVDEDFADAPSSYESEAPTTHVLSDLQLGGSVDADNLTVANSDVSPFSVAAGANANTPNGDGSDEDGWPSTVPPLTTASAGLTYRATVPISGASAAGQVCGWIDFNRNGAFDDPSERACGAFAAGATSAVLNWLVPITTSAGPTYLRLRASYNTTQVTSPTGAADSGEVEDHSIAIYPAVRVNKVLTGGSPRRFDLLVNGTTVAAAVGNGGTSGTRTVYHSSTFGAPDITVPQNVATTAVPLTITERQAPGFALHSTTYRCVDGTGSTIASGNGTSISTTIPASTASNGQAQNITCTFTNSPVPQYSMLKTVRSVADTNGSGRRDAGDVVTYSFTATNTGDVALTDFTINDPFNTSVTCPSTSLPLNAVMVCTGTHVLTQAEVDSGEFTNSATSTVNSASGGATSTPTFATVLTPVVGTLRLTKTATAVDANSDGIANAAGDRITWAFTVVNDSNVTLTTVAVDDPKAGPVTCAATTLAPGAQTTCTAAPYVISPADADAGSVTNTATASGVVQTPGGATVTSAPASTTTPTRQPGAMTLVKTASRVDINGSGSTDLGDRISYSFTVRNTGTVTLDALTIDDPQAGAVTCRLTTLAPGEETICTSINAYVITQADVDAGRVVNTARARAQSPLGGTVVSPESTATTLVFPRFGFIITKTGVLTDVDGNGPEIGDRVAWTVVVSNTGTSTLSAITIQDRLLNSSSPTPITCPATTLAAGASMTCSVPDATVTQGEVDVGIIGNRAFGTARRPDGFTFFTAAQADFRLDRLLEVALTKQGAVTDVDGNGRTNAGDTIRWSFTLANTGTASFYGGVVDDPQAGPVTCPWQGSPFDTRTLPGESLTCTADNPYVITADDAAAGVVTNTATASAIDPFEEPFAIGPATADVPVEQVGSLALTKRGTTTDVDGDGQIGLGDEIDYTFEVTNTGPIAVADLAIDDPGLTAPVTCPTAPLAPGGNTTCVATAPWVVSQQDVNGGYHSNVASASGRSVDDGTTVTSPEELVLTPVDRTPTVSLTKDGSLNDVDGNGPDAGDTIDYTFVITNTGTVQYRPGALVDDPLVGDLNCPPYGSGPCTYDVGSVTCADYGNFLDPGESTTCSADAPYTVTQADVDAGEVRNTAIAQVDDSWLDTYRYSEPATDVQRLDQTGEMLLEKFATRYDLNGNGIRTDLGDLIVWNFQITNTGTAALDDITVVDPRAGSVTCQALPPGGLQPGRIVLCTSDDTYTVTQADVDAGIVTNTAVAQASTSGSGEPVTSNPSSTETPILGSASLALAKTATVDDLDGNGTDLGDEIGWAFEVTNTGTVTVSAIAVDDPLAGPVTCAPTSLAPGAEASCTADAVRVVTQSDVDAGAVNNTARATALDPGGNPVSSDPSSTTTPVDQVYRLALVKTATSSDVDGDGDIGLGDEIDYTFEVTNDGTVRLSDPVVADPLLGAPFACGDTPITLAPGESVTCAVPYTVTQLDVNAGVIANIAGASATDPGGGPVSAAPSSAVVPLDQTGSMLLEKFATEYDANGNGIRTDLGDLIVWNFQVTNTGTVTLDG